MRGDVALRGAALHCFDIPASLHCEVVAKGDVWHHLRGFQHQVRPLVHMIVLGLVTLCLGWPYQCL